MQNGTKSDLQKGLQHQQQPPRKADLGTSWKNMESIPLFPAESYPFGPGLPEWGNRASPAYRRTQGSVNIRFLTFAALLLAAALPALAGIKEGSVACSRGD